VDFLRDKQLLYWIGAGALLLWFLRKKPGAPVSLPWEFSPSTGDSGGERAIDAQEGELYSNVKTVVSKPSTNSRAIAGSTIAFVKQQEGLSLKPYRDAGGYSVGYGHFLGSEPGPTITRERAEAYLNADLAKAAREVNTRVRAPLSQSQFDALVSFVFNVGTGAFAKSTLLRKLNAEDYTGAAQEFRRWIYSQGNAVVALINRRKAERELFERG